MAVDPDTRKRLIEVAYRRLSAHQLEGLRALVTPAALFEEAGVSRDTAYRAFRRPDGGDDELEGADRVLVEVAEAILAGELADPGPWTEQTVAAIDDAMADGADVDRALVAGLRAAYEHSLGWDYTPLVFGLAAGYLPVSPTWKPGQAEPPAPLRRLAERLREVRRAQHEQLMNLFMPLLQEGMSFRRLRPRHGISPEQAVALLNALADGARLLAAIDPDRLPPDLVATAIYELALALSEPGSYHDDPRRPDDDPERHFDGVLRAAEATWRGGAQVDLTEVGKRADPPVPAEVVLLLFPRPADLADSVIRSIVVSGDRTGATVPGALTLPHVRETLRRLTHAASELPEAFRLLDEPPARGTQFLNVLEQDLAGVLAAAPSPVPAPERTAHQLVELCRRGPDGWIGVEAILDLLAQ